MKDHPNIVKFCTSISNYSIYALVVLMPLIFLPWSANPLNFNKQAALIFLSIIALFAWMVKTLLQGSLRFKPNRLHVAVGIFIAATLLSTLFSWYLYGSFWGLPRVVHASLLSVLCLGAIYMVISSTFAENEIHTVFRLLGVSAFVAMLYGALQALGIHVLAFLPFTKTSAFNTVGSLGGLGIFSAVLLPVWFMLLGHLKGWNKTLFAANIVLAFLVLIIVNYPVVWWVVLAVSAVLAVLQMLRKDMFDARLIALPVFFFILSLFFIIFAPQMRWFPPKATEITLSAPANIAVSRGALTSSPVLGSGPGTFAYGFKQYKEQSLNASGAWNVNFDMGHSRLLTMLVEVGALGFLAFLLLLGVPLFYAVAFALSKNGKQDPFKLAVVVAMVSALAGLLAAAVVFNASPVLDFLLFLAVGILAAVLFKPTQVYLLRSSSVMTLTVTILFTAAFIFGLGLLLLEGQRYIAEVHYYKGLMAIGAGKADESAAHLKKAVNANIHAEHYFNQLALVSLTAAQAEANKAVNSQNKAASKAKVDRLAADAVNAANVAVKLSGKNADNWAAKGYVCQNLIGMVQDALTCAIASYDNAIALNPFYPYYFLQQGNAYFAQGASLPKEQSQKRNELFSKAADKFNKAISLKSDYALAYFNVALLARAQQRNGDMVLALQNASKYSQNDPVLALQIGLMYYQEKSWQEAKKEFQRAILISPNYAEALYYLGLLYDQLGEKNNAIIAFSRLAQIDSKNQTVKRILSNLQAGKPALDGLTGSEPAQKTP